ncbi:MULTISPECIES: hypothetical protein [unclassified Clostridium]|uniref:hypothetical protein n=1 Tax=unclassified Clostridium TaxID=2614128 RepID=UPI0013FB9769|nr:MULTISPECIES: hypothetical protein [unclassified Clostridium]NFN94101.1 hypothetical protein [Clostridium botulinum]NFS95159.1 hypothetical protein [Clostridium botulinum]
MCNQEINGQGVWNVVQTVGKKINGLKNRKIELKDEKEVPVLFREQDGACSYLHGRDRPKWKTKRKSSKAISETI